jgi:general secretion pathway protein D
VGKETVKKLILLIIFITLSFSNTINLNFKNLNIDDFIKFVAKIENKNILLTQNLSGKIDFISIKPIKKETLYPLLLSILETKGYTIVQNGEFLKVVRSSDASRENLPINALNSKQMNTVIISPKNVNVTTLYPKLRKFLSKHGLASPDNKNNKLIISDYPENIKTIKKLIFEFDKDTKEVKFIKLQNSKVNSIYPQLDSIIKSSFDKKTTDIKIVKDENSNSLIIIASKEYIKEILSYIKKLDTKENLAQNEVEVLFIKNSNADDIKKILDQIYAQKKQDKNVIKPSFTINSELNAIIVSSTKEELESIKKIIASLDIEKPQVYVKAQILEISETKAKDLGTELGIEGGVAGSSGIYTISSKLGGSSIATSSAVGTALTDSLGDVSSGLAIGATLHMLRTFDAAKVLSEPSLLCTNNQESTIYVGKTVSVLVGESTENSSTAVTKNSYQREDIGLTLKVTPRISADNKVSMKVTIVVEDAQSSITTDKPITSKREIITNAIVKNGENIIIGGLTKQTDYSTEKKVPVLGDIPIISYLFSYKYSTKDSTNLVLLLTPYIIEKSSNLTDFKKKLSEFYLLQEKFNKEVTKKYLKK